MHLLMVWHRSKSRDVHQLLRKCQFDCAAKQLSVDKRLLSCHDDCDQLLNQIMCF